MLLQVLVFCLQLHLSSGLQVAIDERTNAARKWTVPAKVPFGDISRLQLVVAAPEAPTTAEQEQDALPPSSSSTKQQKKKLRIATKAVGLNFADVFTVLGYYAAANLVRTPQLDAFCPGLEFSGILMDDHHLNNNNNNNNNGDTPDCEFHPGDRVFGFSRFDSYADQVEASPEVLRKLPPHWSFEQGAAFLVNALTAWHGLVTVAGMPDLSRLQHTNATASTAATGNEPHVHPKVVLVHSAVGGVGLYACELAARRGALVVGIVGNEGKLQTFRDRMEPLCPEAQCIVRCSNKAQFSKDLLAAVVQARSLKTGTPPPTPIETVEDAITIDWGVDFVMESYGSKYFEASLDIINAGGSLATFGSTTYNGGGGGNRLAFLPLAWQYLRRPRLDPGDLVSRNIRVGGFNLIFLTERTDQLAESLDQCIRCLEGGKGDGTLAAADPPLVGEVFEFEEAPDALRALRSGQTVGKVVLSNRNNPLCA